MLCCVASSSVELEKLRKHIKYKKKNVMEFYISVLPVILDIPGMKLVCVEATCIMFRNHFPKTSTETDISLAIY